MRKRKKTFFSKDKIRADSTLNEKECFQCQSMRLVENIQHWRTKNNRINLETFFFFFLKSENKGCIYG